VSGGVSLIGFIDSAAAAVKVIVARPDGMCWHLERSEYGSE
jgi:hypothetical protein